MKLSRLRFNFGFLLEADYGTSRLIELNYPSVQLSDDVTLAPLQGSITATRTTEGIYLQGKLESSMSMECVRCLDEAIVPVDISIDELYYYPPQDAPEGEARVGEDGIIDLAPLVRELSLLSVPIKVLCRPDCQGLCQECGANLNYGDCGCAEDDVDPRLSVLQSLLNIDRNGE
ncbi:MAG: DUF177 domain-containing protein [Anaerolineae bacterium]|nr:DUF177 domain-containing protein [Promineifilum sp.]MCZ2114315.1 DUF177 domain-containing protein [Anaerolineae bacterium]HNS38609.1 DUF177 domain-containing protein [Promineifilum sp.]